MTTTRPYAGTSYRWATALCSGTYSLGVAMIFTGGRMPWNTFLKSRTLILLVSLHLVTSTRRSGLVLLALEVAVDDVVLDDDSSGVLECLDVAAHVVADRSNLSALIVEQNVGIHLRAPHQSRPALHYLDAAPDTGSAANHDLASVLGLHVAYDPHTPGDKRRLAPDLNRALHGRALQNASLPGGDL